jgi:hypothetical protein
MRGQILAHSRAACPIRSLASGKAAMVGKIEGLGGNLGDIAWIDEAGLA